MLSLMRPHLTRLFVCTFWSAILALCTAGYGFTAGPALKLMFGGNSFAWPALLADHLPPPSVASLSLWLPGLIVVASLMKGVAYYRYQVVTTQLGQNVLVSLQGRLHRSLMASSCDSIAQTGEGEWISRLTSDTVEVQKLVVQGGAMAIRDLISAFTLLACCFLLDWRLALVSFVVYPLAFWPVVRLGRKLRRLATQVLEEQSRFTALLMGQVASLQTIQIRGEEAQATTQFLKRAEERAQAAVRSAAVGAIPSPLTELLGAVALSLTLLYTVHRVQAEMTSPENVMSFFATLMLLYQPVKGLSRLNTIWQPGLGALSRIRAFHKPMVDLPSGGTRVVKGDRLPEIRCEAVCLRRGDGPLVGPLNLRLPSTGVTVLMGSNGSGKTSLALAIARMIQPVDGMITVGGDPLDDFEPFAWRRSVGWLPQGAPLNRGTVYENIVGYDANVTAEMVHGVIEKCGLGSVIASLPNGIQTALGDDGAGLSGGERQRLALARALIHNPKLLVLDEPSVYLDEKGVESFASLVQALAGERSVLLITHDTRLAAIADRQVELDAPSVGPVCEVAS